MRIKYILDTSVLIHDPNSFTSFVNSDVILPVAVLDELDKLKKQPNDAGKNARVAIRLIDKISDLGDVSTGIILENDIWFKIDVNNYPNDLGDSLYGDTRILACAQATNIAHPESSVTLVSNDINLRIRAKALSIFAEGYEKNKSSLSDLYEGIKVINHTEAGLDLLQYGVIDPRPFQFDVHPNECLVFLDEEGHEIAMGRKVAPDKIKIVKKTYPWGISPRNKEQSFSIDLIMDPSVPLVTLIGRAGTGKSLITLATALELVLNKREYDKFIIYRPIQPVGNDIGYLPGTMEEKLAPWFQAILDNFEVLFTSSNGDKWKTNFEAVRKKDRIQMEALTYIRGRSIPNAIILIDECQNLSKEDVKTILTRAGENTKIILTGDIEQIDNSTLDAINNGLTYAIEKFKDSDLSGHITFTKGERSKLASKASEIL